MVAEMKGAVRFLVGALLMFALLDAAVSRFSPIEV
jgi:hypothetical protein